MLGSMYKESMYTSQLEYPSAVYVNACFFCLFCFLQCTCLPGSIGGINEDWMHLLGYAIFVLLPESQDHLTCTKCKLVSILEEKTVGLKAQVSTLHVIKEN